MKRNFIRVFELSLILFFFVTIGGLLPREIKTPFPRQWGWVEGKFNRDMTGWWFSTWQGEGSCRLDNSIEAFKLPGSKIMLGLIYPPDTEPYPHLWVTKGSSVIDLSCSPEKPACRKRRVFAVVDSQTLKIEQQNSMNDKESKQTKWGVEYLKGLKSVQNR